MFFVVCCLCFVFVIFYNVFLVFGPRRLLPFVDLKFRYYLKFRLVTVADGKALQGFALGCPKVFVGFLECVVGFH